MNHRDGAGEMGIAYWERYFREQRERVSHDYDGWLAAHDGALPQGGEALDLGCGSGTNTAALLARGMRVTAADFSPSAVQTVKACFPETDTVCFDMTGPFPFASRRFDAVVADLSLHYFSWADTRRIVDEIGRVLAPCGTLLARVHSARDVNPEGLEQLEPGYYISNGYPRRYFTVDEITALFSGWRIRLEEREIVRFRHVKRVIELAAVKEKEEGGRG